MKINSTAALTMMTMMGGAVMGNVLSGSQNVTVHLYQPIQQALATTNPTFCGDSGLTVDLKRITAVEELTLDDCGKCLNVTGDRGSAYVMAVDRGGAGLDLNEFTFMSLYNDTTGRYKATWAEVDADFCEGIRLKPDGPSGSDSSPTTTTTSSGPSDYEVQSSSSATVTSSPSPIPPPPPPPSSSVYSPVLPSDQPQIPPPPPPSERSDPVVATELDPTPQPPRLSPPSSSSSPSRDTQHNPTVPHRRCRKPRGPPLYQPSYF